MPWTQQLLETPLGLLPRRPPVGVGPAVPLAEALAQMQAQRIGSMLILDERGAVLGILTRGDVIGRITLPGLPLETPVSQVMSQPVRCLTLQHTVNDAATLMHQRGIRHVPLTDAEGRAAGIVTEHDLWTLQRLAPQDLGAAIRGARDVATLAAVARDIRRFARNLMANGVGAHETTQLISHFNDLLNERLVRLLADELGLDLARACWLAFGSQGRSEQTLVTDQDNGLVFASDTPDADRPRWLELGRRANDALAECGFPLCKGGVMAGNPACCLTSDEWAGRFDDWMAHGAPEDLLQASIYFDLRPLAGEHALAQGLRAHIATQASALPRFTKQLADNALLNRAPLNWRGAIETTATADGHAMLDLKMRGATLFVDAARLYALAHGITATTTRERLTASARVLQVPAHEAEAWVGGFDFLQSLRLRAHLARVDEQGKLSEPDGATSANWIEPERLNDIERQMLKEALRQARRLQQRMALDYQR